MLIINFAGFELGRCHKNGSEPWRRDGRRY